MTTATIDQPKTTTTRQVNLAAFSKMWRATGYSRVSGPPIAAGAYHGTPARLVLPLERVTAVDIAVRLFGTGVNANPGNKPDEMAKLAANAVEETLTMLGVDAAKADVTLRRPPRKASGADLDAAVLHAAANAAALSVETALTTAQRTALERSLRTGALSGLAHGKLALIADDGRLLADYSETTRLRVVFASTPGYSTAGLTGSFGQLPQDAPDGTSDEAVAHWLAAASATTTPNAIRELFTRAAADSGKMLGLIGGHTDDAPVAALFGSDHNAVVDAQRFACTLAKLLPAGWNASATVMAAAPVL